MSNANATSYTHISRWETAGPKHTQIDSIQVTARYFDTSVLSFINHHKKTLLKKHKNKKQSPHCIPNSCDTEPTLTIQWLWTHTPSRSVVKQNRRKHRNEKAYLLLPGSVIPSKWSESPTHADMSARIQEHVWHRGHQNTHKRSISDNGGDWY